MIEQNIVAFTKVCSHQGDDFQLPLFCNTSKHGGNCLGEEFPKSTTSKGVKKPSWGNNISPVGKYEGWGRNIWGKM